MFEYKQIEPRLWTVGHFVEGYWVPESDHSDADAAARRVHYLNGENTETDGDMEGLTVGELMAKDLTRMVFELRSHAKTLERIVLDIKAKKS